jgi:hypothetical protein
MGALRKFTEELAKAASTSFRSIGQANTFRNFRVKIDGSVTASAAGTLSGVTLDAPWGIVDRLRLQQGNKYRLDMLPVLYYHLCALFNGRYPQKVASTPGASAAGSILAEGALPLHRMGRRRPLLLDGRADTQKLELLGVTNPNSSYASTNMASYSANVRASGEQSDRSPAPGQPFAVPSYKSSELPMETASADILHQIPLQATGELLGILVMQFDASATGDSQRTDGIARRLTWRGMFAEHGQVDLCDLRWGELKCLIGELFNIEQDSLKAGIAFVPTLKDGMPIAVRKGDALSVNINTTDTIEGEFTAVSPGSGDRLYVLPILNDFEP